ncbi:hypothetical protein NL449_27290, partial [Klebsiella pneumoniae]|nr:hypothetical protein [Klebsiella pneumoniae]
SLNVVGSSFIMVSLYFNFNLPAMVAQVFWLLFTFIGILRVMRARDWKIGGSGMSAPCDRST